MKVMPDLFFRLCAVLLLSGLLTSAQQTWTQWLLSWLSNIARLSPYSQPHMHIASHHQTRIVPANWQNPDIDNSIYPGQNVFGHSNVGGKLHQNNVNLYYQHQGNNEIYKEYGLNSNYQQENDDVYKHNNEVIPYKHKGYHSFQQNPYILQEYGGDDYYKQQQGPLHQYYQAQLETFKHNTAQQHKMYPQIINLSYNNKHQGNKLKVHPTHEYDTSIASAVVPHHNTIHHDHHSQIGHHPKFPQISKAKPPPYINAYHQLNPLGYNDRPEKPPSVYTKGPRKRRPWPLLTNAGKSEEQLEREAKELEENAEMIRDKRHRKESQGLI